MEKKSSSLERLLDNLTLEELRSLFKPKSAVGTLRKDTLIRKFLELTSDVEDKKLLEKAVKAGKITVQFIPDYAKISKNQMIEMLEKKKMPIPTGKDAKKKMYEMLFDIKVTPKKSKSEEKLRVPKPVRDEKEEEEEEIPIYETIEREELEEELSERNITLEEDFLSDLSKKTLYSMLYGKQTYREETYVVITKNDVKDLIIRNKLSIESKRIEDKLLLLNRFSALFSVTFSVDSIKKGDIKFPVQYFADFPVLYTLEEKKRIVSIYKLDLKSNLQRIENFIEDYIPTYIKDKLEGINEDLQRQEDEEETSIEEDPTGEELEDIEKGIKKTRLEIKGIEKEGDIIAKIHEKIKFTRVIHESFRVVNAEGIEEVPIGSILYVLRPKFVYLFTIEEVIDMLKQGSIYYERERDPALEGEEGDEERDEEREDFTFRKTFDDTDIEALLRLVRRYISEYYGQYNSLYNILLAIKANKELIENIKDLKPQSSTGKILHVHRILARVIEEGSTIAGIPSFYFPIYERIREEKMEILRNNFKGKLSPALINIVGNFVHRNVTEEMRRRRQMRKEEPEEEEEPEGEHR